MSAENIVPATVESGLCWAGCGFLFTYLFGFKSGKELPLRAALPRGSGEDQCGHCGQLLQVRRGNERQGERVKREEYAVEDFL